MGLFGRGPLGCTQGPMVLFSTLVLFFFVFFLPWKNAYTSLVHGVMTREILQSSHLTLTTNSWDFQVYLWEDVQLAI